MITPVQYLQTDPRWADHDYSVGDDKSTLKLTGCGPTVMAMAISSLTNKLVTTPELADWSMANGFRRPYQGTDYGFFEALAKEYNLTVKSEVTFLEALYAVRTGNLVICQMCPGNWSVYGDYILWYGVDGNNVYIHDPQSDKEHRSVSTLSLLSQQAKRYWIVCNPLPTPNINTDTDKASVKSLSVPIIVNDSKRYYPGVKVNGAVYLGVNQLMLDLGYSFDKNEDNILTLNKIDENNSAG